MIQIVFYTVHDDPQATVKSESVPRVGDKISVQSRVFEVRSVHWIFAGGLLHHVEIFIA